MDMASASTFRTPVIVIGAGPVGLYAAFQIGMRGYAPIIIDSLSEIGGQCAALYPDQKLYDVPGFTAVTARALVDQLSEQLAPLAPRFLLNRRATSIWGSIESGFNVETDTGETITGAAVIFAGGAGALRPRRIEAAGIEALKHDEISFKGGVSHVAGRRVAVIGDGSEAIDAALDALDHAASVSLIHSAPLRAAPDLIDDLRAAAASKRLTVIEGNVEKVSATDGRLSQINVRNAAGSLSYDIDLLLVQAGLELVQSVVTGLGAIADPFTGETSTSGVFVTGDANDGTGRPPVLAAGFSEAVRAAEVAARRINPEDARTLPHSASSPTIRARLNVA